MNRRQLVRALALTAIWPALPGPAMAEEGPQSPGATPQRLVALGPGALRLLVYLDATGGLCAIEAIEQRGPSGRPYTYLLEDLSERLPVIGPGGVGRLPDLEQMLLVHPDLAVAITLDDQQVDMLNRRLGIQVLRLSYGELGELQMPVFYDSLRRLAKRIGRGDRAEALISAIDRSAADLAERLSGVDPVSAYIGGISLKGQQGFASTQAQHLPLRWGGADNLADRVAASGHRFLDLEQILAWDPPTLFVDGGGLPAVLREAEVNPAFFASLRAVRDKRVFATLAFNSYNTNVEHGLINAWFIASRLYPERFADLDVIAKADQIYRDFYGRPMYSRLRTDPQGARPGFAEVDLLTGEVQPLQRRAG